jgi:hypothetical protein
MSEWIVGVNSHAQSLTAVQAAGLPVHEVPV